MVCAFGIHPGMKLKYSLILMSHSYAVICPFLYAFNLRDFRAATRKLLKKSNASEFKRKRSSSRVRSQCSEITDEHCIN